MNMCLYFTDEGKSWLSKEWKLCSPLKDSSDVSSLTDWISEVYVDLAMINYPYPANFLTPLPGYPIKVNAIIRSFILANNSFGYNNFRNNTYRLGR